jgi:hypothetical protein
VEDEAHALFDCTTDPSLLSLRSAFLDALATCDPETRATYRTVPNYNFLLMMVASKKAVQLFAKYIFLVLNVFQDTPRFYPVVFRTPQQ